MRSLLVSKLMYTDIKNELAKSFDINGVTPYILLAIFIARIGCSIEGCCQGRLYLATVEELLCLTCFVLIKSGKIKITFNQFYVGYMLWRFVAEFFKESYHLERSSNTPFVVRSTRKMRLVMTEIRTLSKTAV